MRWAIGIAIVGMWLPTAAFGQGGTEPRLLQPETVRQTGLEVERSAPADVFGNPGIGPNTPPLPPSVVPGTARPILAAAEPEKPAPALMETVQNAPALISSDPAYEAYSVASDAGKPWKLPQPSILQKWGIDMGGWVEQGITYNSRNPDDRFNGPVALNDRSGEYQLNQAWLYLVRPTKTDGHGFDLGGRIDMSYGTDWRYGKCLGLEDRIDSPNSLYGLVMPQFYGEVAINNLTIKGGHYAANFGYEAVPAPANFFYSHSYAMCYGQPILLTGVQADYQLTDNWTVTGGFSRGWEMFEDNNNKVDIVGGVRWFSDDKDTSFSFMTTSGPQDDAGSNNRYQYTMVLTQKMGSKWLYAIEHDLGMEEAGDPRTHGNACWYGIDQYLIYTINSRWSAGLRSEWFRDQDGSRVAGIGNWIGSGRGWTGLPGFQGDFFEIAAGINWRPHTNVLLRPELRWDWYNGTTNMAGQLPYGGGTRSDQLTAAVDLVVTF